jgi:hypothetical protein
MKYESIKSDWIQRQLADDAESLGDDSESQVSSGTHSSIKRVRGNRNKATESRRGSILEDKFDDFVDRGVLAVDLED